MTLDELTKLAQTKGFSNYGEAFWKFKDANPGMFPDAQTIEKWLNQR